MEFVINYFNYDEIYKKNIFIEFIFFCFNKAPLYAAVEKENYDIVRLLCSNDKLDINLLNKITFFLFNDIYNPIFKLCEENDFKDFI